MRTPLLGAVTVSQETMALHSEVLTLILTPIHSNRPSARWKSRCEEANVITSSAKSRDATLSSPNIYRFLQIEESGEGCTKVLPLSHLSSLHKVIIAGVIEIKEGLEGTSMSGEKYIQ